LITGCPITNIQIGIPVDNHLAMDGENIVPVGNFYMAVNDSIGDSIVKFTLLAFAQLAGIENQPFHPRLAFDPQSNRYFFTFLAGFDSQNTDIIVAFPVTGDPTADWNIYSIPGNPNGLNHWTDYSMTSITNDNIFLTINLIRDGESWQLGFVETIIWQIGKTNGYEGTNHNITRINGITYDGQTIRNLCPAESVTETMFDEIYFVSNRNFAMEADTFFLIKVDPNGDTPEEQLSIKFRQPDTPYGPPPNARQQIGFLHTNYARILEAFRLDDEIQFVGNTRNKDINKAGIYHGIIKNISDPQIALSNHIVGDDYELGYPEIIYTGETSLERDAIIAFNHTSKSKNPGVSTLCSVPREGFPEIVQMVNGSSYVNMLNGSLEKWGNYLGTQRNYNDPSSGRVSGFIGTRNNVNAPYICHFQRPKMPTNTEETQIKETATTAFPNPLKDKASLDITISENGGSIQVDLYGINGEKVDKIYSSNSVKSGRSSFSFDTSSLATGIYLIKVILDGKLFETKTIVKM
jgi:hypothetical protein